MENVDIWSVMECRQDARFFTRRSAAVAALLPKVST